MITYWAILITTIVIFLIGAAWYTLFAQQWLEALGKPAGYEQEPPEMEYYIISVITAFCASMGIALFYYLSGGDGFFDGLFTGIAAAVFFSIMPIVNSNHWGGQKFKLSLINGGYYLTSFAIGGAIYGLIA